MPEKNLETEHGLKCPKCGGSDKLQAVVDIKTVCIINRDGTLHARSDQNLAKHYADKMSHELLADNDVMACHASTGHNNDCCGYTATVADFRVKSVRQMLLDVAKKVVGANRFYPGTARQVDEYGQAQRAIKAANQRGLDG